MVMAAESPYEQFINTFFSHFDGGAADTIEFEFKNWRMEIRFKKDGEIFPVTDTPFHMLLQIKRVFDAVTVKNLKTGQSRMRYIARGVFYEFLSEDIGGTLLRLRLENHRPATSAELEAFNRRMAEVR